MAKKRNSGEHNTPADLVDSFASAGTSAGDDWDQLFDPGADNLMVPMTDPEVAQGDDAPPMSTRFLGFRLGQEHYAVPILHLSEVVRFQEITAVPRVRRFVRGIISVRGTIVPILDLKRRLSQGQESDEEAFESVAPSSNGDADSQSPRSHSEERRVLITNQGGEAFGLLVDEVSDVFVAEPDDIEPPPATLPRRLLEYVSGIARVQGRIHTVLEVEAVLRFSAVARAYRAAEVSR